MKKIQDGHLARLPDFVWNDPIGGESGIRYHFQKVLSNCRDFGPTIDLLIKLKIYLENR